MTDDEFGSTLAAAKEGDEAAFSRLFRSVQPLLLRYLGSVAPDLAEDVAAETWISVVRGLARFRGDESGWQAWVFTIARARLVDARRAAARRPRTVDVADPPELADPSDVSAALDEIVGTEQAVALLRRLPPDQAEAVFLRHVVGFDAAETAKVLGKRPGAVRVAVHRGLRRLAELLDEEV